MKKLLSKADKPLLFLTVVMFAFGLLMIFSASSVKAAVAGNPYSVFIKQAITLAICAVASIIAILTPLRNYKKLAPFALYFIIGALFLVFSYGAIINSVRSWIDIGFYNFQPSEFAKIILIIYFGVYYQKYKDATSLFVVYKPLLYGLTICALTFLQPDFGTMCIIAGIVGILFMALPIHKEYKKRAFQIVAGGILVIALFLVINNRQAFTGYQINRFNFLNPCQRYTQSTGYQVCNGFIAINNGGLTGVGLGNSTQKFLYLPAAYTDFIFPVIIEELGLVTGILIILVYVYMLYRIVRIARRSSSIMGSIIAYGVAIYMLLHIFINLSGVLGLLPLTGVPLPFLSYGGSYALNLAVALAIVQRIEIENNIYLQKSMLG